MIDRHMPHPYNLNEPVGISLFIDEDFSCPVRETDGASYLFAPMSTSPPTLTQLRLVALGSEDTSAAVCIFR